MSFLDHIARCNNADLSQFEPWFVGDTRAGFIHRDFLPMVAVRSDLFSHRDGAWYLEPSLDTPDKRTAALRAFQLELREKGLFGKLWREEQYPVAWRFSDPPQMAMERASPRRHDGTDCAVLPGRRSLVRSYARERVDVRYAILFRSKMGRARRRAGPPRSRIRHHGVIPHCRRAQRGRLDTDPVRSGCARAPQAFPDSRSGQMKKGDTT